MGLRHPAAPLKRLFLTLLFALLLWPAWPAAERMGYAPEEFALRRQRLASALQRGTVVMFGETAPPAGVRFRQDNDFFYLTGNESINAVFVMDAASAAAHLFMPKLTPRDIQYEGPNWLSEEGAAKKYGFASIQPLAALPDFLVARSRVAGGDLVWTRLSNRDSVNHGRLDEANNLARRRLNPFAQHPTEDALRVAALREALPSSTVQDIVPHLDRLRLIKTPREIEIMRYAGRISAEAIRRAIQATAPGKYEYELEAEATYWMIRHGMQGAAYPAIVGSGPMGNRWHYEDNGRQMQEGELIVMDYGGSLDYLTIDITRTWPVSGRFTDGQLKAYQTALEAQKAIIAAIRPGVTRNVVRQIAEDVYRKNGFDPRYAYVGHYVGLSVHDVGDWNAPFEAGMTMAIEPIIDIPSQQLHVRVEDTILVTPQGAEILSTGLPKEVDELLALMKR